jgi:hypothetical protein
VSELATRPSRGRRAGVWALVVVASLLLLVSSLTIWVKRQLLDNHNFTTTSQQVLQDPQVRGALSVYLVNQLYANVDVAAALRQRLPDNLAPLAAPAAAALRQPATSTVGFMLARPRVQQLWVNATSRTHQKLVNVLENKTGYGISTGNGVVTLNLHELLTQLADELGLPGKVAAKVPPDSGTIVLLRSSQLQAAQTGVSAIRVLSVWLLVLVLVLYAVAVWLGRGERRVVLRRIAWAFVLVGVLLLVARKVLGNYVIDALTSPQYRSTGHHVWLIGTEILGQIGAAGILYGLLGLLGVWLAGTTRPARAVRTTIAPVLNERQGIAWGAAGLAFLLLVLWGPTHALRTWWGILLIGGLLAAGVAALRRQTLVEAPLGDIGPTPLEQLRRIAADARRGTPAATERPSPPAAPSVRLAQLDELHAAHALTDAEYERARARLLS